MYEVTIGHPAIQERRFLCSTDAELRALVDGVVRAQGARVGNDRGLAAAVAGARSQADTEGTVTLAVLAVTVTVTPAEESAYACQGHESVYLGLGESVWCKGECRPRRAFDRQALLDLSRALDDTCRRPGGKRRNP
ncbi:hypothetical protein ABZ543_08295 [Streptomyces roseifaciens]